MKTKIIELTGKLLTILMMAAFAAAISFAQDSASKNTTQNRTRAIDQVRGRFDAKHLTKNLSAKTSKYKPFISANNLTNFNLGSDFIIAMIDSAQFDADAEAKKSLIVDLVYLIDSLENQPENLALQKILKSITKETSNAAQIHLEIENAFKSYASRQTSEQKWYLETGSAITKIIFSTYVGDNAAITKGLSETQKLVKIAPLGTPEEIINPMNNLTKYVAQTAFSEGEYAAIFNQTMALFKTVNA